MKGKGLGKEKGQISFGGETGSREGSKLACMGRCDWREDKYRHLSY